MTTRDELVACPFCESDDIIISDNVEVVGQSSDKVYARCNACGANGPGAYTDQTALAKWNTRASRQEVSVTVEAQRLADAMWQLLDDMGANGQSVCLGAKAEARVAYEPFRDTAVEYADWMSLADAERILKECGQ